MAVKVPPLLHQRPKKSQIAWYKANKMPLPPHLTGEKKGKDDGYSAAQAKKDVGEINKEKAKKKAREAAIAAAAQASKKNKELVSSSERVREMGRRRRESGEGLGGGLETNRDILSYVRAGGTIKAGRLGEAAKPDASMAMTDQLKKKMITDKDKQTLGKVADLMRSLRNKDKKNQYVRKVGLDAMKAGKVDPARGHSPTRFGREQLRKEEIEMNEGRMKDIVTGRKETERLKAQDILGGPVKEKPKMPPGKQPAGYRYVRALARKAMKAGMRKEEVEQIDEVSQALIRGAANTAAQKSKEYYDDARQAASHGHINPETFYYGDKGRKKAAQADRLNKAQGLSPKSRKALKDTEKAISAANEEVEQIDELKKSTLASYVKGAAKDIAHRGQEVGRSFGLRDAGVYNDDEDDSEEEKNEFKLRQRTKGIEKAAAKLAKEEIDLVSEQDDTMEKKEMAQTQLHFMKYAAEEILEFIEMGGEIEEWYQNKLSKVHSDMEGLHSYIEGEKRRTGMVKEEEQIDESVTHWEYSGTVNGKDYTITVPRGADLSDHLGHKKIQRENPHLEPHEVKAVADTSGEDEEHVEVEHGGKKYTHRVTNNQEPRMVYSEEVEQTDEAVRVVDRFYPGVPHDKEKRKNIADTVRNIRKDPDARGGMTGFNRYQDFFGGRKARLGAERTPVGEALDPVGKENSDIDNDRDTDETDVYLHRKRKAIGAAIKKKVAEKMGKKQ